MTRSFGALAASLLALTLILAACSGGSTPQSTGTASTDAPVAGEAVATDAAEAAPTLGTELNACEIVTSADLKAATGIDGDIPEGELVVNPTTLSPGHSECTYEGDFGRIIVDLTPEDGANLYDAARGSYDDASDITGIGDGAFNSVENNRAFIWQGPVAVMLTMFINGDVEQLDVATELGKTIVAKL